jgi:hypothetical protein
MRYRELGHKTAKNSTSSTRVDTMYHITALASANMTGGRFRAFAAHIYVNGDIPRAKYSSFSSTFTVIRRGNREKRVVEESSLYPYQYPASSTPVAPSLTLFHPW